VRGATSGVVAGAAHPASRVTSARTTLRRWRVARAPPGRAWSHIGVAAARCSRASSEHFMPGVLTLRPAKVESSATVALVDRAGQGLIVGALPKSTEQVLPDLESITIGNLPSRQNNGRHFLAERFLGEVWATKGLVAFASASPSSFMVAGARFELWKRPPKFEFLLSY
jgi:hypothetical protein